MQLIDPKAAEQAIPAAARAGVPPQGGWRAAPQGGGTFLGILLGLMVGLGAALAVAIYVAKVPVPFVNKNSSRSSVQDAAEAERNRNWDPNAPLRGRGSGAPSTSGTVGSVAPPPPAAPIPGPADNAPPPVAVPAPAEVKPPTRSAERTPDKASDKPADKAAEKTAAKPPERKPGQAENITPRPGATPEGPDPLGDLLRQRAAKPTPPPTTTAAVNPGATGGGTGADPFTYFVQAGAFRTPEDAESQRVRLGLLGMEARVTEREQAGRTVYRVRVGPFQNRDAADRVKDRLDGNGYESALVRVQR